MWFFNGEPFFMCVSGLVRFSSTRFEMKMMAELIFKFLLLFCSHSRWSSFASITYHYAVYGLHFVVSFSCGFSLVYLHHIAMHFIHMLCCSIPIQRASPNNGTHFAFRSFVCSFRSSCILWFVLYDSKTVFTSQHNSYLFLGCFVRYGRLHTMNEWQKFIIRVKIYQSKIRF